MVRGAAQYLDRAYDEQLALTPENKTQLEFNTNYGKLDDYAKAAAVRALALGQRQLKAMRAQFPTTTRSTRSPMPDGALTVNRPEPFGLVLDVLNFPPSGIWPVLPGRR